MYLIENSIPSGFPSLDSITTGLPESSLIVLSGAPGIGKTSFALNILEKVALNYKKQVIFFSMQLKKEVVIKRILCSLTKTEFNKIETTYFTEQKNQLEESIIIDDASRINLDRIIETTRKRKQENDLSFVVVDDLQGIDDSSKRFDNKEQSISKMVRELKNLTRELNIPILILSQLNRGWDSRPELHQLKYSGAIESYSDIVIFLYRENFSAGRSGNLESLETVEVIIENNHFGPSHKTIPLNFIAKFFKFEELPPSV